MTDTEPSRFKISFDEEPSEPQLQDQVEDLRINKLNQRINWLTFLLPCLIGALMLFGYFDIKKRFENLSSSGITEVQTLSKTMESRFSSLSIRQAKLESMMTKEFSDFDKSVIALKIRIEKAEKAVNKNVTSSKTENKDLESRIEEVDKSIPPIKAEVLALSESVKTLEKRLKKDLEGLSASLKEVRNDYKKVAKAMENSEQLDQIGKDLSELSSAKLDKKMFDLALRHEERLFQQRLDQAIVSLEEQLLGINKRLQKLEQTRVSEEKAAPAEKKPAKTAPPPEQKSSPGGITEKVIQ